MARRIARDLQVLAVACGSLVLVAVLTQLISPSSETAVSSADHHHHHHPELAEASTYKLVPTPLLSLNPNRKWHNAELAASYDRPTIGSDLVYLASSESDEGGFESGGRFLGLTDATPLKSKCPGDHRMTFLPFPDFSPGMVRLRLEVSFLLVPFVFASDLVHLSLYIYIDASPAGTERARWRWTAPFR